jgi:hypothetical protein
LYCSYFPQIYVAFIKVPVHKYIFQLDVMCSGPEGSCIAELKSQLIIILAMKITIDNVKELLPSPNHMIIFAKRKIIAPCNRCCGKKGKKKRKKAQIVPEDDDPEQSPEAELMVDRWTRLTVTRPKTGLKAFFDPKLRKQAKKERAEAKLAKKREKAETKAARDEEKARAKLLKAEQKDASAATKAEAKAAKADAKAAKAAANSAATPAGDDEPAGDAAQAGNAPLDNKAAAKAAKEEKKAAAASAKAEKKAAVAAVKADRKAAAAAAKEAKAAAKAAAKANKADDDFAHATTTEASGESDSDSESESESSSDSDSEWSSAWEISDAEEAEAGVQFRYYGTGLREASGDDDEGVDMPEPAVAGGEGDADAAGEDTPFVAPKADAGDLKVDKKLAAQKAKLAQAEAKAAKKAVRGAFVFVSLISFSHSLSFSLYIPLLTHVAVLRCYWSRPASPPTSLVSLQAGLQAKKDKAEAKKVAKAAKAKAKKAKQMAAAKEKAKKQAAKEKEKERKAKEKARAKKGKTPKKKKRDFEDDDGGSEDDALLGDAEHDGSAEEDSEHEFDAKAVKADFPWQLPEVRRKKGLLYERQRPAYPGRYDGGKAISPVAYWEMRLTTAEEALEPLSQDERKHAAPLLKALRMAKNELDMAKAQEVIELEQLEEELALDPYDAEERMKDYGEMVIMYGFVVLFAVACPLGALLGFVGTYLELKVDSVKMVFEVRRPSPMDAKDIGAWLFVLKTLTYLGIFFNLFLLFYTGDLLVKYTSNVLIKWLIFFAVEHVFIITQIVIDKGVPDEPPDVALQSRRQQNIRRRLVEDIKLMEDNTLEPADAIANLMSNPRFMRRMPMGPAQWNRLYPDQHPI